MDSRDSPPTSVESLPILYRDDSLVAVAKPSGLFVHHSEKDRSERHAVVPLVRDQLGCYVYPVHRLDRATSGIVVLALTREAAGRLGTAFSEHRVCKTYRALVRGFPPVTGCIDRPLVREKGRGLPAEHPLAVPQEAVTEYRRLEQFELPIATERHPTLRCSLLELCPKTGRFHQIRRHLNAIAYPVIGDTSHGDSRHNKIHRTYFGMTRLMLAAVRLELPHPTTGRTLAITCPVEESFADVITRVRAMNLPTAS